MALSRTALAALVMLGAGGAAHAAPVSTLAAIQVQCTGGSKVTIRWGHQTHDQNEYFSPYFVTRCDSGINSRALMVNDAKSEFEIQTEGGKAISYTIKASVNGQNGAVNTIQLIHDGTNDFVVRDPRVGMKRSSGPNKYGEQNFRITVPDGTAPKVRVDAMASGNKSAQMALTWGHKDFNDNHYFKTWTVKPANVPPPPSPFALNTKSEFEIQTEGGTATGYHLSAWLDFGQGTAGAPTIEVFHGGDPSVVSNDVQFTWTGGNVYGERNVTVLAPWLPDSSKVTPPPPTGLGTLVISYFYGNVPYQVVPPAPVTIEYKGMVTGSSGTMGDNAFDQPVSNPIHPGAEGFPGTDNTFTFKRSGLRPGTWTVSAGQPGFGVTLPSCPNVQIAANGTKTLFFDGQKGTCH